MWLDFLEYFMKMLSLFAFGVLSFPILSHAAYTVKDGKLIAMHEMATLSVQEHYSLAKEAMEGGDWFELIRQSQVVVKNFPETPFAQDCYFYLGVAYFNLQELDFASRNFSLYLKKNTSPKFFEKAIEYKYLIAEQFGEGAKRRLLGQEALPKWLPSRLEAIAIYDEVVMALPQHDLAVKSLFGKANILFKEDEFSESIEAYQTLLRRFPKHPLACDSYIAITKVYHKQAQKEYPDPDYLDLAALNIKKFKMDFPGNPKTAESEAVFQEMLEVYAKELYKTAQFYERTKKPSASVIYYSKILTKYPSTKIAMQSQDRLEKLKGKVDAKELEPKIIKSDNAVIVDAQVESESLEAVR